MSIKHKIKTLALGTLTTLLPGQVNAQQIEENQKNPVEIHNSPNMTDDVEEKNTIILNSAIYDPETKSYGFDLSNGGCINIMEDSLSYESYLNDLQEKHNKIYSRPTKYITDSISIYEGIKDMLGLESKSEKGALAVFIDDENTIKMICHTLEDKDKAIALLMKKNKRLSKNAAEMFIERRYKEWTANAEVIRLHEESHRDDWKKGLMEPNLPLKYMISLSCLTEIKGFMVAAAQGWKDVQEKNDASLLVLGGGMHKNYLLDGLRHKTYSGSWQEFIGKCVFDEWLYAYTSMDDKKNDGYMARYREFYEDYTREITAHQQTILENHIADNPKAKIEYYRRVSEMFKDVRGLGDMRGVIDPDFKLSKNLQAMLQNKKDTGLMSLTANSQSTAEAYDRIGEFFRVVKEADADEIRTNEENEKIANKINELKNRNSITQKAPQWSEYLASMKKQESSQVRPNMRILAQQNNPKDNGGRK